MRVWDSLDVARPPLILLDLDGTLVDSAPGYIASMHHALAGTGLAVPADDELRAFIGPPLTATFRDGFGLAPNDVTAAVARYREHYQTIGLFDCAPYPGVVDLLDELGRTATLAIATSKPTPTATRVLAHVGLTDRFAFIGGADFGERRPDKAAVIAHTLTELGRRGVTVAPDDAVMVGDREHDVIGARAHGIDTVGVLWGYGSADELQAAGATALATCPADVERHLTGRPGGRRPPR